jgi:HK97 family phage major capsid protein
MSMLLVKDTLGRRLYNTKAELVSALMVRDIVEVPVMENLSRVVGLDTLDLKAIVVNLYDYTVGADKGGAVSMFDDFDIDYNQYKYLIETRASGAIYKPKAALVFEQVQVAG